MKKTANPKLSHHPFTLTLILSWLLTTCFLSGQVSSLGPIGGGFEAQSGSNYLKVTSVTSGGPGEQDGLLVGDFIYAAFGKDFGTLSTDTKEGWKGSVKDFGDALNRAEAGNGILPLTVLRSGVGKVNLNIQLTAAGGFGPAYPLGSPKFDAMYQWSCEQIHSKAIASSTGDFGYNTGLFGLIMLSHPNWNDSTGSKPYRLSVNKLRDASVAFINSRNLTPAEEINMDGTPNDGSAADSDPNDNNYVDAGSLENWQICTAVMFLAEYRKKTNDQSVTDATLQYAADILAIRVQTDDNPPNIHGTAGPTAAERYGMMGHKGIVGDYSNSWWSGLNIINSQTVAALAMLKDTTATINDTKFQACWDYMRRGTNVSGGSEDGNVAYVFYAGSGWDSSARTAGALFGLSLYGGLSAADEALVVKQKDYITRQWQRMQHSHAYTVGGVYLYQFALPYLNDRQQRYIMENIQYFYQLHRNSSGTLEYFGGRGNNGGDSYLNYNNAKLINVAMAQAVHSGNLPSFPAINPARIHADFKAPVVTWPSLDARATTISTNATDFNVDITNYLGTVLNAGDYTATWSHISGPATATFSAPNSATTTATFPSNGLYRIQLEVTKGAYTLTEPIDVNVKAFNPPPAGYTVGGVNYRIYKNITGLAVADLTTHANYPNSPDTVGTLKTLEGTYDGVDYGSRIQGYIIPQVSGDYTFYISSDDASEFKFGADEASALKICGASTWTTKYGWTNSPEQISSVQTLTAGTPYFFEVNHKQQNDTVDHLAVAWSGPGISTPTIISEDYLALPDTGGAVIIGQPVSQSAAAGDNVTFNVIVSGQGPFLYEWTLDGIAYWPVSTSSTLTLNNISAGSAGAYRCQITSPSGTVTSNAVSLTVTGVGNVVAGGLWREVYEGIGGGLVSDLTASDKFPKFPTSGGVITETVAPSDIGGNYGQRWTGWILPDTTGAHIFYIASDDASELWLSTDDKEYNKVKIASKVGYTSVKNWSSGGKSVAIDLVAGSKYYIEVRHKEGGGGDHCAVTWQRPGDPVPTNGAGSIPSGNLEYRVGGVHVTTQIIELALTNPTTNNVRIRPGLGLNLDVLATPAPMPNDSILWTMESGTGTATFENPNALSSGVTFSSEGNYTLRCTVDNGGIPATVDVNVTVSSEALATWTSTSIAEPTAGSGTVNSDSSFTVIGSGADIYGTADECQLFHQTLTGNFDVRARVVSKTIDGSLGTHAQLMARENSNANSRNIAMTHESADRTAFQYRSSAGASTTYKSIQNLVLPLWIRLVRSGGTGSAGQTFTGYYSTDGGATWIQRETVTYTTAMPESLLVGFAVSSAGSSLNTVEYDNVSGFKISPNYGVVVDAGTNNSVDVANGATLSSTVSDDAKPTTPGAITTTWVKLSGPGTATFGDASASSTTVNFDTIGQYIFRQYATDGEVTTYDDVTIDVTSTVTVDVVATDSGAAEAGPDTGTFTITRNGGPTTAALTVNISMAGTSTNGIDYTTIASTVTIPAGSASTTVTLTPVLDLIYEGTETAEMTLMPGAYIMGASPAIVSIDNHPDADGDGLPDDWENTYFGNLTTANGTSDADNDGLSDAAELAASTDPTSVDSDADGYSDSFEISQGTDPNDDQSKPNTLLAAYWNFDNASVTTETKDVIGGVNGVLNGGSTYTADASGYRGVAGDRGMDFGTNTAGQRVNVANVDWLNAASADDQLTISYWQKVTSLSYSCAFWALSPTSADQQRGIQVASPWINSVIYYDIGGAGAGSRISVNPSSVTWTDWNHVVLVKKGGTAEIWVNGIKVTSGTGINALKTDISSLVIGANGTSGNSMRGVMDDFSVFKTALNPAQISTLAGGASPLSIIANRPPVAVDNSTDLAEDAFIGTAVLTVTATDPDPNETLSYAITAGNIDNAFAIDNNGNITVNGVFDDTVTPLYSLTVTVTDSGSLMDTATIDITILDRPDVDNDGLTDTWEITHFGDLTTTDGTADTDSDGLNDAAEFAASTDPNLADTDADGYEDGFEIQVGTDPLDDTSKPNLTMNLVHHWKLDESSGLNIADEVVTNQSDGVANSLTWEYCEGTGNLRLDGSSQKVDIPSTASITGTGDFGISLWVKNTSTTTGVYVQQRDPSAFNGQYRLSQNANGVVEFMVYNNGYQFDFATTTTVNDGVWHHVMAVRRGEKGSIYIDGVLAAEASGAVKSLNSIGLSLGYDRRDSNRYYKGQLDDVRLYTRALAPADAALMMTNQAPTPTATQATVTMAENVALGTLVSTISVTDPDASDLHCFRLSAGNDAGLFAIDNTGKITTVGVLDYEAATQHTLTVSVHDNGTPSLEQTTTVTINVSDIVIADDSDGDTLEDQWEFDHYGSTATVGAFDDTDADGLTAFQEMVFGGNPNENDSNLPPVQSRLIDDAGTPKVEFKFRRPKNYDDLNVTYQIQQGTDMVEGNWVDYTLVTPTWADDATNLSNEWLTYKLPMPTGVRVFYRCRVIPNP